MALNPVTFLSTQTKVEKAGLDWETEKERLDEETPDDIIGSIDDFTADAG
jgi:hypothetical protein